MGAALASIADILSRGKVGRRRARLNELGPEHVSALRGRLQKLYAPSTANYDGWGWSGRLNMP